jgi:hypothetical protein
MIRVVKRFRWWMLKIVMKLCKGCGRVLSSYTLLIACVQTEQFVGSVDVMCVVYCVNPECGVFSGNCSLDGLDRVCIGVPPPKCRE